MPPEIGACACQPSSDRPRVFGSFPHALAIRTTALVSQELLPRQRAGVLLLDQLVVLVRSAARHRLLPVTARCVRLCCVPVHTSNLRSCLPNDAIARD